MKNLPILQKVLIGALLIIAFFLGKYVCQNKAQDLSAEIAMPEDTVVADTIDTSNWLSYKNEKLGFSIKYPEEFEVLENVRDDAGIGSADVLVRVKGKETTGNTIIFKKTENTVASEIARHFTWRVTTIEQNPDAVVISYYTGDANFTLKTYLFSEWKPSSPLDEEMAPHDMYVAEVSGEHEINEKSVVEHIMETLEPSN